MAVHPLLNYYETLADKQTEHEKHGVRYTIQEKDIGVFEFILGGNSLHTFHSANRPTISRSTITRHLRASTKQTREGEPSVTNNHYMI